MIDCDYILEQPVSKTSQLTKTEYAIIQKEIDNLLLKEVLETASPEAGQIISHLFI